MMQAPAGMFAVDEVLTIGEGIGYQIGLPIIGLMVEDVGTDEPEINVWYIDASGYSAKNIKSPCGKIFSPLVYEWDDFETFKKDMAERNELKEIEKGMEKGATTEN